MLTLNLQPETTGNGRLPVEAVIFDLDGTLVNTIDIYFRVIDEVLERLSLPAVSREVVLDAAKDGEFNWERMLPDDRKLEKEDLLKQMWGVRDELFPAMLRERTTLIPGADDLLRAIREGGAGIGLVTSTPRRNLENKWIPLGDPGIKHFFKTIITADDVEKKKPSPEALITCAGRLGVEAKKCVTVGDVRTDIIAGKAAGMITIGVLTGFDTYDQLRSESPDLIVGSVADLVEKLECT
jgi:phosphoglycolate phosphatase